MDQKGSFSIESSLTNAWYSIESLLHETKPSVTEKHEFDYRDESIVIALLRVVGLFWSWCKDQSRSVLNRILLYKYRVFHSDFDGRNRTHSSKRICFWLSREIKNTTPWIIWTIRGSNAMDKILGASIDSSKSIWLSIETFMEGIKTVVSEKFEFEYRDKSNVVALFFEFSDNQDCDARHKTRHSSMESFVQVEGFQLRPKWKNW